MPVSQQDESTSRRRHGAGPRVALLLVLLALVPLAGAGWFAALEFREVESARDQADFVAESARELVTLTDLRAGLLDERNWVLASAGAEEIGMSTEAITILTGIAIDTEAAEASARVDALVLALDDPAIAATIAELRRNDEGTISERGQRYVAVEAEIGEQANTVFDDLMDVAGDVPDAAFLLESMRILEWAALARQSVAQALSSYFSAQFSGSNLANAEVRRLIEQAALYDRALTQIRRTANPGSGADLALGELAASSDVVDFRTAIDELALTAMSEASAPQDEDSLAFVLEDVNGVAATFEKGKRSADAHLGLVDAAGEDVVLAGRELGDAAEQATNQAVATIAVLSIASLAFTVALTRFIGRPLQQLAAAAQGLGHGVDQQATTPSGPFEVRAAARALNEASGHLTLAERQATALASGDLDNPALEETAPGSLGVSLQRAVRTLALSMSEREEFRRRLAHEATHDGLTQLPNRKSSLAQLHRGLARTGRTDSSIAVMFIDLDDFKGVNDHFGHPVGDAVLRTVAHRLVTGVREGDHVGRLGGDEFLVIAEPVGGPSEATELAERLLALVGEPIMVGEAVVHIGASIGVALAYDSELTADELLRDADLAVFKAKSEGSARIEFCDEDLRAEMANQADLEHAIREAIAEDQLELFYQPITRATDSSVIGLEALLRWNRPGLGLVPPDDFIPFAERSDLIIEIDRWVIRQVARQLALWAAMFDTAPVPVSINVSGRHLGFDEFTSNVLLPLEEFRIDPAWVVIEVTESSVLDDLGDAAAKLQILRSHGIRVAIDDFGTGYTSLAHLRTLPIDILKIDRSFTGDPDAESLVKLIIDTGHLLGARITAEGIETDAQARQLAALGADELQGYLFGRPCAPVHLTDDRIIALPFAPR